MQTLQIHRRAGALGFVLLAVAATVAIFLALRHHDTPQTHFVGGGAAPAATNQAQSQAKVFDSTAPAQQVASGAVGAAGELTPLPASAFDAPVAHYRAYAVALVPPFDAEVRALGAALRRNDRGAARAAWQRADSTFDRIGAAYGALGSLGDAIDGAPGGLPGGVDDPRFTGLQRIEHGLWTGAAPASLAPWATRLHADIPLLRRALRSSPIDPLTYATRAHEILEDVQRDRLTAQTPSDSGVRATADGIAATRVVLATLAPVLNGRGNALTQSRFWLTRLSATMAAIRRAHGTTYPPTSALSRSQREALDGRLGATLEALSGIPGELETISPPTFARIP